MPVPVKNYDSACFNYLGIFYGTMDEYTAALAAAEEAPVEKSTEDTPVEEPVEEPAETGIVLSAIPAIVALAAIAISKRR